MEENKEVAAEKEVETETTQAESPQAKAEVTEPQTEEGQAEELPADTEEQRKAFQEMRLENKRLKEEMAERGRNESAFDRFHTPPAVGPTFSAEQFTDPYGNVDWNAYNQAQEARITAQVTGQIEERLAQDRDEADARTNFPEVFADADAEQEVADRWFAAKLRGETITISDVAERVAKKYSRALNKAEKVGAEKALGEIEPKEQAGLSVSGQNATAAKRQENAAQAEETLHAVRHGSEDALTAAMAKIPWANK